MMKLDHKVTMFDSKPDVLCAILSDFSFFSSHIHKEIASVKFIIHWSDLAGDSDGT